jgi:hypothetical protein
MLFSKPKEPAFGEAIIRYDDGDYHIVKDGTFVKCAMSGQAIVLDELKYWSVQHQEAYVSPEMVLKKFYPEEYKKRFTAAAS